MSSKPNSYFANSSSVF